MPLVLVSGFPSAGKTTRALQLRQFFESKIAEGPADARIARLKVHLVNDQTLGVPRSVYHTAKAEKDARAEEYSAVKRLLSRDDIVIADGLNYIKGFRYQLYCEAKAVQTPSCVVSRHRNGPRSASDSPRGARRNPRRKVPPDQRKAACRRRRRRGLRRRGLREPHFPVRGAQWHDALGQSALHRPRRR